MLTRTAKIIAASIAMSFFALGGNAMAHGQAKETKWEKAHPRRDQVNDRLANQNKRIEEEVKEGDMTKAQAHQFRQDDKKIRQEERDVASLNNGHITKAEQKALNQQENRVSKEIGK